MIGGAIFFNDCSARKVPDRRQCLLCGEGRTGGVCVSTEQPLSEHTHTPCFPCYDLATNITNEISEPFSIKQDHGLIAQWFFSKMCPKKPRTKWILLESPSQMEYSGTGLSLIACSTAELQSCLCMRRHTSVHIQ